MGLTREQVAQVRALFDEGDVNKTGVLDKLELRQALYKHTRKWLSNAELDEIWKMIDADGSSSVTFDEFLNYMGPIMFPPLSHEIMRSAAAAAQAVKQAATDRAKQAMHKAADPIVDRLLDQVEDIMKRSAADPDMPPWVQRGVTAGISGTMRDVRLEIRELAKGLVSDIPEDWPEKAYTNPVYRVFKRVRGHLLYTLQPYDKCAAAWRRAGGFESGPSATRQCLTAGDPLATCAGASGLRSGTPCGGFSPP